MKGFLKEKKYLIPFMFLVIIFPLIVLGKLEELKGDLYLNWSGERFNIDFFTYHKKVALIVTACILIVICIVRLVEDMSAVEKIKKFKVIFIASGIYMFLTLASAIFSYHRTVAFKGFVQSNQSVLVQISYVIIFLSAILLIKNLDDLKILLNSLLIGSVIISFIGILQYFNMDIIQSKLGQAIVTSSLGDINIDSVSVRAIKMVYGTLFHKDYVGSYYALIVPLSLGMLMWARSIKSKGMYGIVFIAAFFTLYVCDSRGGLGGALFGILMVMLFKILCVIKADKKKTIAVVLGGILVTGIMIGVGSKLNSNIAHITENITQLFKKNTEFDINNATPLKKIVNEEDRAGFKYKDDEIIFTCEDGILKIYDGENEELTYEIREKNFIVVDDEKYKDFKLQIVTANEQVYLSAKIENLSFLYRLFSDKARLVDNKLQYVSDEPIEKWGFNGKELLFTVRGYIWSRSLPLLKNAVIIGYGADTYTMNFPQHDYIGKYYGYHEAQHIVDKPHNMYLQTALDNGIIALLIFLFILFISICKTVSKEVGERTNGLSYALVAALAGYLITGIINDNRISVAPIFFFLLGCCCVIRVLNTKSKKTKGAK